MYMVYGICIWYINVHHLYNNTFFRVPPGLYIDIPTGGGAQKTTVTPAPNLWVGYLVQAP